MVQTCEALLEPDGHLQFLETPPRPADQPCRVLAIFTPTTQKAMGEARHGQGLAGIRGNLHGAMDDRPCWRNPEEDAAWAHLQ